MTDLVRYEQTSSLDLAPSAWKLAEKIAATDFVPTALRGKPEAVLACILAGHEAGVSPMQALAKIHIIEGRPAMSAELMRALVLRQGHELVYEKVSTTEVVAAGRRKGAERWTTVTWTMDDARRGNLDGKTNWKRWPRAMLTARATGELCRMIFPDVLAGISHTVEELTDGDSVDGLLDLGPPEIPTAGAPAGPKKATARAAKAVTRQASTGGEPETRPPAPAGAVPALPGDEEPVDAEIIEDDPPATDDAPEISDAEIIEPPELPEQAPPAPVAEADDWPSGDWSPGDFPTEPTPEQARRYTGPQIVAIKLAEKFGVKGNSDQARRARLDKIVELLGREIKTSKELTPDEIRGICEHLDTLPDWDGSTPAAAPQAPTLPAEPEHATAAESAPAAKPASRTHATPKAPTANDPEEWTGDQWRELLVARKVKVTELLAKAQQLAGQLDPPRTVALLDAIAGTGLAGQLVGFVEDLSLDRRK